MAEKKIINPMDDEMASEDTDLTEEEIAAQNFDKAVKKMNLAEKIYRRRDQIEFYRQAAEMFADMGDYENSGELRQECLNQIKECQKKQEEEIYAKCTDRLPQITTMDECLDIKELLAGLGSYKDSEEKFKECCSIEKRMIRKKQMKKLTRRGILVLILAVILGCGLYARKDAGKYLIGNLLLKLQRYSTAQTLYAKTDGYKDSDELQQECFYQLGIEGLNAEKPSVAIKNFRKCIGYKDTDKLKTEAELSFMSQRSVGDQAPYGNCHWDIVACDQQVWTLVQQSDFTSLAYDTDGNTASLQDSSLYQEINGDALNAVMSEAEQAQLTGNVTILTEEQYQTDAVAGLFSKVKQNSWLATPGDTEGNMKFVTADGQIMNQGYPADSNEMPVRLVIQVKVQ